MTNEEMYRQVGLNIAFYRKLRHLTQEGLAELVGMSRGFLSQIEASNLFTSFSIAMVFDISRALEIEPKVLFEFHENGSETKE